MNTNQFRKLLDCAFRAPNKTRFENMALMELKRAWYITDRGLSAVERQWLTLLATRGGWVAPADNTTEEASNA